MRKAPLNAVRSTGRFFCRLWRDRSGNVMMILGFSLLPLVFATGMGIDYSRAMKLQTKPNATADAAALSAVSLPMMSNSNLVACAAARNMFTTQASNLYGLVLDVNDPKQLKITVTDSQTKGGAGTTTDCSAATSSTTAASYSRTATVTYYGQSTNAFANILGINTLTVKGTSQTNAAVAPNIDFYLQLDVSPSMAIAATQSGIDTMVSHTSAQGGCAFACHQISVGNGDTSGNPTDPKTNKQMDNYALARSLGVILRGDLVTDAAQNLMDVAASTSQTNGAIYRMSIASFDSAYKTLQSKTSDFAAAKTAAGKAVIAPMYSNSYALASNGTSGVYNNDTSTSFTAMTNGLATVLTTPGNGTNASGDKPQGIIFIVTDGVRDEAVNGDVNNRWIGQLERPASKYPYSRSPYTLDPAVCESNKAQGFRIAILYTSYLPLPTNSFYNGNVKPFQTEITPNLQACASPGLFSEVSTDGDISAALAQLFQAAVSSAHLLK
jgi:Flp pilus assembly protein TadG